MMLHRQTLHEDMVLRPDMQDPAQQRSAHRPACQVLESCTATNLPNEYFNIQSDTSNVMSRSFSCGCHTSDDRNTSGDVQDGVGEAGRCCRAYPAEKDFRASATKGVNSVRNEASRVSLCVFFYMLMDWRWGSFLGRGFVVLGTIYHSWMGFFVGCPLPGTLGGDK
eukprot:TRINITY_DN9586_c0_g1_i2.p1 TRINITY_DN9586_c0_g1~~TRINITY_DN9586_c0_g1_i2.p1  ORF type:complete len:166 (-),score=12.81 TRINITY_DN9586_c0_g1_i2:839-1336(-)